MRIILEMIFVCFLLILFFVKIFAKCIHLKIIIVRIELTDVRENGPGVFAFVGPCRPGFPDSIASWDSWFLFQIMAQQLQCHGRELEGPRWLLGRERGTQRSRTARTSRSWRALIRYFTISEYRLRFQSASAHLWSEFCIRTVGGRKFYMIIYSLFWWKDLV